MTQEQIAKKNTYKLVLIGAALLLFLVSVTIHLSENYVVYRLLRALTSVVFLGIIIKYKGWRTNVLLAGFLTCYGLSSFLTIWYENTTLATIALLFNFVAFLFVIKALWKKASFKNLGIVLSVIFAFLILIKGYLLYEFVSMLKDFTLSNMQYAAMLIGAMALIVCSFLALLYNHALNTKASLVFAVVVFLFVFAEVFRAMGYYDFDFGNIFVYIARVIMITATAMLAHFVIMPKSEEESLTNKIV